MREGVSRDRLDTGRCAAGDDRDRGGGRNRRLVGEALHEAVIGGIGTGTPLLAKRLRGGVDAVLDRCEHALVPDLRHDALERDPVCLKEGVKAHDAEADRALAHGGIFRTGHFVGRAVDEVLQHIVEEAHHVLDNGRVILPLIIGFEIE